MEAMGKIKTKKEKESKRREGKVKRRITDVFVM